MNDEVVSFPGKRPDAWQTRDLELIAGDLTKSLGLPVSLSGGHRETLVTIRCSDLDELMRLCDILQAGDQK
ncbi:hypothetical protein ACFPIF_00025 [Brevundimonas faecalis]|uniref:hypothetical protein n=1 Tax=Brevundimonas faecalis TaxID=947378 RepID=UPI00360F99D0